MPSLLAWVDTRPLFFLIGLPLAALVALGLRRLAKSRVRWGLAVPMTVVIYLLAYWFIFAGPFIGVERLVTSPMTWRMGETGYEGSKQGHVILSFRDDPGHRVGTSSDDLARYLRGLGSDSVDVTFEVTTDWGCTRCFRIVRIAGLESWRWEDGREGFYGWSGSGNQSPGPSPFP